MILALYVWDMLTQWVMLYATPTKDHFKGQWPVQINSDGGHCKSSLI